MAWFTTA
jgi:threonine aldolase